jgi:hypothetical protein
MYIIYIIIMSNIDDDLYLMSVSKKKGLRKEYDELSEEHHKIHNELVGQIIYIRQLIITEEKLLKNLEKRKLKKKYTITIYEKILSL